MTFKKHIPFYLLLGAVFVALKFYFREADSEKLTFILQPTATLVAFLLSTKSVFVHGQGYVLENLHISIDKSCSGFNFWLICFVMMTLLALPQFEKKGAKISSIPIFFALSFLLTILVNSSRIIVSVLGQNSLDRILGERPHYLAHSIIGTFIYLFFLVLIYLVTDYLLKKYQHEKLASS